MQNLTILSLAVPEISLGAQKYKVSHVTLITPLLKVICRRIPGLDIAHLTAIASAVRETWLVPTRI